MPRKILLLSLVAAIALVLGVLIFGPSPYLYRDSKSVETYLLAKTPLGSSEEQVLTYLRQAGLDPKSPWRGDIPAGSYPPTSIGGKSYVDAVVGRYSMPFTTSVEAFYIFDSKRRLVDVRVRKTTDAL